MYLIAISTLIEGSGQFVVRSSLAVHILLLAFLLAFALVQESHQLLILGMAFKIRIHFFLNIYLLISLIEVLIVATAFANYGVSLLCIVECVVHILTTCSISLTLFSVNHFVVTIVACITCIALVLTLLAWFATHTSLICLGCLSPGGFFMGYVFLGEVSFSDFVISILVYVVSILVFLTHCL